MGTTRKRLGIGVIGLGWMGRAHSRSYLRMPTIFPERTFETSLVVCADASAERRAEAEEDFGFTRTTDDWRRVIDDPDVDVVVVTAPNMLHEEICVAAAAAGKHTFCEKPVGGTPDQTTRVADAARRAGIITGVGYNYRFAPLVAHLKSLLDDGRLGTITNYRGRFFSMYGADPMGALSWRYLVDEGGYGVSSDILSHAVDLAMHLNGPIERVFGTRHTFITDRPIPSASSTHYARGSVDDPTGAVTNEDYAGAFVVFANGSRGSFESSRAIIGPESQMALDIHGTAGAASWNLETMNELRLCLVDPSGASPRGYTTVYGGDRYPMHGHFVPGDANSIGFEDLVTIEDFAFLTAVAEGRPHRPGFEEALDYVSVQAAWLRSCAEGTWQDVTRLDVSRL